ncbi:MAG TPA: NAD-dependent deacylase [bacterium]|nr:NAD-dependent deacylase [bacterium]
MDAVAAMLRAAHGAVALTGAGISTESGLPDFRSPGGLWTGVDPMRVASLSAFRRDPGAFYAFYQDRLSRLGGAQPNPAHRALADLERANRLRAVITQNVEGLHQAAGSRHVLELHGSLCYAACADCGVRTDIALLANALAAGRTPQCPACAGPLRPDVVLFGELLPPTVFAEADALCRAADLMLVVGSSLTVTPAADLPQTVLDAGGVLVIVNREPTPYDVDAAVILRADAGSVLPAIASLAAGALRETAEEEHHA